MNNDDEILEALEQLKSEWKNRTEFKQKALIWAINKRKQEAEK